MSIHFAGSNSLDDRRRRRLVVNADDPGDEAATKDGTSGAGIASELVASAAAGPWVPYQEWRIWTYSAIGGLLLIGACIALALPNAFRPELAPLTRQLLQGERPTLAVLIQSMFWFLSAQLATLVAWYRTQCKIDFRGRYRIWPWAAAALGLAALCSATDFHRLLAQIIASQGVQLWRAEVVLWLLPVCVCSLPLIRLIDRDVRHNRSTLCVLRLAWVLGASVAAMELFAADMGSVPWVWPTRLILPLFAVGTLLTGLWLHARFVAYVCPDPPENIESATLVYAYAIGGGLSKLVLRPRATGEVVAIEAPSESESDPKPKRGRKKAATEDDEAAATKRKRRTPTKRVSKPRTRTKDSDSEVDDSSVEVQSDSSYDTETVDASQGYESTTEPASEPAEDWDEVPEYNSTANKLGGSNSTASITPPTKSSATSIETDLNSRESAESESPPADEDDEESGDTILRRDSGMTADQFKGLSKRQKRELRRQSREKQRNQRN